jgi:squalene-associated FAD-dependent desaturase
LSDTGSGRPLQVGVIGAGWAGCAAAVSATLLGHRVTLFEATKVAGGRARAVPSHEDRGAPLILDNGQHILIGAYSATLDLMQRVGADPDRLLRRQSLALQFADGSGLRLPDWPAPLDVLAGIASARGWSLSDKLSLLRVALGWRRANFVCDEQLSVADLCRDLRRRVRDEMIDPLCVSALNTPSSQASASVFLRVLKDSLFSGRGGSNLLLPRVDLGQLFPVPSLAWLQHQGATVHMGRRVAQIGCLDDRWEADGENFDTLILATPVRDAMRLLQGALDRGSIDRQVLPAQDWLAHASLLAHEAIATVYVSTEQQMPRSALAMPAEPRATLARTMLALRSGAARPAQFVFDRGQLGGPAGLLAFVVSAGQHERAELEAQVLAQGRAELGLSDLRPMQTIVEKRATFACTPGLLRPSPTILPGLLACGDYVAGPYPSTLEGAVRSGQQAARCLGAPATTWRSES